MKKEIKNATAIYSGGGVYIYYGQLTDGNWFRVCDSEDFIEICNSDTSVDEADYYEFYEKHSICTLTGEEFETFWNEMLLWIIHNAPEGNYSFDELETRFIEKKKEINAVFIEGRKDGYSPSQCYETLTVRELIEVLENYDSDMKVYLRNDNGYTYGSINCESIKKRSIEE